MTLNESFVIECNYNSVIDSTVAIVISLLLLLILTVLYLVWYYSVVVRHPVVYGGKDGLKEYLINQCPILSQPYRPTIWAWHYHAQTILAHCISQSFPMEYTREMIKLNDGGMIALDWSINNSSNTDTSKPIILILPGFTGDSTDTYVSQIVHHGHLHGYQCVVYIKQGLGGIPLSSPRLFTFSNVEDLKIVLDKIKIRHPPAVIAVAISFGGITLTHYLHAAGSDSIITSALIFSMPWNVKATAHCFDAKLDNMIFYRRFIMNILKNNVKNNSEILKQNPKVNIEEILKAKSTMEFDACLTVPTYNLSSVEESQKKGDADKCLSGIRVPYIAVASSDDPLVPSNSIPISEFEANPNTVLLLTKHGGHFGFLEGVFPTNRSWISTVYCQFISTMKAKMNISK